MQSVRHLPLNARKLLGGRLLVFENLRRAQGDFERAGATELFADIEDLYLHHTERGIRSEDKVPWDTFTRDTVRVVSQQIQLDPLSQKHATLVNGLLQRVESDAAAISCTSCSCKAPLVCRGEDSDDEIVERGGACILPIKAMFRTAMGTTSACYADYASLPANLTVSFSTATFQGKPHDLPVPYFVGGTTRYLDSVGPVSQVVLYVSMTGFGWETYLATMYVLFHECVCHAFQGAGRSQGQPRRGTDPSDAFAEGWMDWIASWLLEEQASRQAAGFSFPTLQRDVGRRFHLARTDRQAVRPSQFAIARIIGTRAAQKLLFLFERLPETKPDPMRHFLRLSLDLNLSSVDRRAREAFAWKVDEYLPEKLTVVPAADDLSNVLTECPAAIAGFCRLIRTYVQTNDFARLVHDANALPCL